MFAWIRCALASRRLRNTDVEIRIRAVESLGRARHVRAVSLLLSVLDKNDILLDDDAKRVLDVLTGSLSAKHRLEACRLLRTRLYSRSPFGSMRQVAAHALVRMGWKPDTAEDRIALAIASKDEASLVAEGSRAIEPLLHELTPEYNTYGHEVISIRKWAARTLGKLRDASVVRPLITSLRKEIGYNNWDMQLAVIDGLSSLGQLEPLLAALEVLEEPAPQSIVLSEREEQHERDPVARAVVAALGAIGGVSAIKFAMCHPRESIRLAAARAFTAFGPDGSLIVALEDKSKHVRRAAAWTLHKTGWTPETPEQRWELACATGDFKEVIAHGTVFVERLIKLLSEKSGAAAHALGEIGDPCAVAPLAAMLSTGPFCVETDASARDATLPRVWAVEAAAQLNRSVALALLQLARTQNVDISLLRRIAIVKDAVESRLVFPGDNDYERTFKDGHGPVWNTEILVDNSDVRDLAQTEIARHDNCSLKAEQRHEADRKPPSQTLG